MDLLTLFTIALYPLLISLGITTFLTYLSIPVANKLGLIDDPKKHKHPGIIHKHPIPRGGGLALYFGVLISSMFFLPFTGTLFAVFVAALLALAIGVVDDKLNAHSKDVSPYFRFLVNILTALIVVASGVSIKFITNPFGEGIIHLDMINLLPASWPIVLLLSDIVSVLWLIWIMNMLNWSKGVDGQMPGIVAISAMIIGAVSILLTPAGQSTSVDATLAFLIAGAALGFLIYNFHPAKIFPGYGATSLYLLLGVVSILSSAKLATAILVMGIPMIDAIATIIRRLLSKKSPFQGDKKHLHHILLKLGYNQRQIALFYWSISGILGLLSLTLESKSKFFAILMVAAVTSGTLLFLHSVSKNKNEKQTT